MYGRRLIKPSLIGKEQPGTSKEVELGKSIGTLGMLVADKNKSKKAGTLGRIGRGVKAVARLAKKKKKK
jgi:hypothetical protein|tara:strand:- start:219 stop:425 length:207 start_codon:yes stop_codon:yes gene_type:complete